jgi:TolB-like protein
MLYAFEEYTLDVSKRELRRAGALVAVEPLDLDVLEYFVRHNERIVSKEELIDAVWSRRIVSDSTISSRITAVRQAIGDSGRQQRLIRTYSRRGFRFVGDFQVRPTDQGERPRQTEAQEREHAGNVACTGAPIQRAPTIAILPFAIDGYDPRQHAFVNGLVEDITTALSQFHWLSVLARSTSFAWRGWAVDIKQLGHDLGAHYTVEGSVRLAGSRMRVTARLIDAGSAATLWSNWFDIESDDFFDLQDRITATVAGAIEPRLERIEIARAKGRPDESLNARQCYLRGLGRLYQWNRSGVDDALRLFRRATEIDAEFACAYGMAAYCYVQRKSYGWLNDRACEAEECARLARRAAELTNDDPLTLAKAGHAIESLTGDLDSGAVFIEQALKLNPNLAAGWYVRGWLDLFHGRPEIAADHLLRAIRLSASDPLVFKTHSALAYAYLLLGRFDDGAAMAERALYAHPHYLTGVRGAAANHALAGRVGRAQELMARVRALDPTLTVSKLPELLPFQRPQDQDKWTGALRRAGLPD